MRVFNLLFVVLCSPWVLAAPIDDARRAVSLVDYISRDYRNAVVKQGEKIISKGEYTEMQDFIALVRDYAFRAGAFKQGEFQTLLDKLATAIHAKAPVAQVEELALEARYDLISSFDISTTPQSLPNLARGEQLYRHSCSMCHGMDGKAQTKVAKQLTPSPSAFSDVELLNSLSPFQAFNTITFGLKNTAMPSFAWFSEKDRWSLAAYIFTFRSGLFTPKKDQEPKLDWQEALKKTDAMLLGDLEKQGIKGENAIGQLSTIRHLRYPGQHTTVAREGSQDPRSALMGVKHAISLLEQSFESYQRENIETAVDLSVAAYLNGYEKAEAILASKRMNTLISEVEKAFLHYRHSLRTAKAEVNPWYQKLSNALEKSKIVLEEDQGLSWSPAFFGAFMIIFREGLEAILLLAIILTLLSTLQIKAVMRWFHLSWVLALVAGVLTWVLAEKLISGATREGMEGWITLVAAVVLAYVSFWILSKRDAERWKAFLTQRIRRYSKLGIATVFFASFLAVYREAFESVLFLQALKLHAPSQTLWVISGVLLGFVSLFFLAFLVFRTGLRLPFNLFFGLSGHLLYFLAVVFVGQGISSLGEANLVSQTPIHFFTLPALGIYPYLETLAPQAGLVLLYGLAWLWRKWRTPIKSLTNQDRFTNP